VLVETPDIVEKRRTFFRYVFGETEGFVALDRRNPTTQKWEEEFFKWPMEMNRLLDYCSQSSIAYDLYYCPMLFSSAKRQKQTASTCTCAWADLDSCPPDKLLVEPTITIQSSPGRYQALWVFAEEEDPGVAEDISRRIAYYHKQDGADTSGWDLTQLLRVPFTNNHKYNSGGVVPEVRVVSTNPGRYSVDNFAHYPPAKGYEFSEIPMPTAEVLEPLEADALLAQYKFRLMPTVWHLFGDEPDEGTWSDKLWQLEMLCFEAGMSREEVFVVAYQSACNKYRRDNKSTVLLWKEVCRAFQEYEARHRTVSTAVKFG
jgi:hypothetical protein